MPVDADNEADSPQPDIYYLFAGNRAVHPLVNCWVDSVAFIDL